MPEQKTIYPFAECRPIGHTQFVSSNGANKCALFVDSDTQYLRIFEAIAIVSTQIAHPTCILIIRGSQC